MKKINLLLVSILTIVTFSLLKSPVLADGYTPYGPHIPEDTGLVDGMVFNIVAVITYLFGIASIGVSKILSNKID
ncbi:hypothetical protein GYA44_00220 [Candidatus Microgenomates bacterium]|jgi:hydrogenase-4 membrane subunit HyfE|nr:hypothetical protein [Candidatus Microgenomates bacterium]